MVEAKWSVEEHPVVKQSRALCRHTTCRNNRNNMSNRNNQISTSDCPGGNRNFNINNNAQQIVRSIAICKH